MAIQLAVNVALIAGLFLTAVFVAQQEIEWLDRVPDWIGGRNAVVWMGAMLFSLPILIASLRK
jgi:CPA2 family monovalent cation:H+ antiporter-2